MVKHVDSIFGSLHPIRLSSFKLVCQGKNEILSVKSKGILKLPVGSNPVRWSVNA